MKLCKSVIVIIAASIFLVGCNSNSNTNVTFVENESTESSTDVTETTVIQQNNKEKKDKTIVFDEIKTDDNNPIDKSLESIWGEADNTYEINEAFGKYYNAWKNEFDNIASVCKSNNVKGYSDEEYNGILSKANGARDDVLKNQQGSLASGEANSVAGDVYKKGTYYFIELYKQHTNKEYQYIYK